jgi:hypothetical protein
MADYPIKKHFGLTIEQAVYLTRAAEVRDKSESYLMREYIEAGAKADSLKGDK